MDDAQLYPTWTVPDSVCGVVDDLRPLTRAAKPVHRGLQAFRVIPQTILYVNDHGSHDNLLALPAGLSFKMPPSEQLQQYDDVVGQVKIINDDHILISASRSGMRPCDKRLLVLRVLVIRRSPERSPCSFASWIRVSPAWGVGPRDLLAQAEARSFSRPSFDRCCGLVVHVVQGPPIDGGWMCGIVRLTGQLECK